MKKLYLALILVICVMTGVYGQTGPKDLILVLDTSASMSSSYRDLSVYLPGAFIQEHLRIGDTFHLIPFSGSARLDIARRVEGRGELETIVGRMLLQYPLDSWSDISAALTFTENYLTSLPSRPKKIVLVSDGIVFLPPGSASRQLDSGGVDNLVSDTKTRLARQGVTLEYVKITPGMTLPSAPRNQQQVAGTSSATGGTSAASSGSTATSGATTTGTSVASGTSAASTSSTSTSSSGTTSSAGTSTASTATTSTSTTDTTSSTTSSTTGSTTSGTSGTSASNTDSSNRDNDNTLAQTGTESDWYDSSGYSSTNERDELVRDTDVASTQPPVRSDTTRTTTTRSAGERVSISPLALFIGLAIIGIIALILIILLISKEMHRSPNKAMSRAASSARDTARGQSAESDTAAFKNHSKELAGFASTQSKQRITPYSDHRSSTETQTIDYSGGPVTLNLFVEDQNTHIGKRNIHSVKPGYTFTVGGGKSDFLIFLVPLPANLGELRVNDNRCTFTPKKPQYFPGIGSQPVQDCIGKTIRVVSDKNYEVRFRFERYEDPLHALNRLLNSVKVAEKAPPPPSNVY